jgi:hypothetical protein
MYTKMKSEEDFLQIECPHCLQYIIIMKKEINCAIFRHGVLKSNGVQIPPHLPKILCDELVSKNLIYGCGKPFQLVKNNKNEFGPVICGYI